MLYIVCPEPVKYKDTIQVILDKLGFFDYDLIDPKSYDLESRTFSYVIRLGSAKQIKINAGRMWDTEAPSAEMSKEDKIKVFGVFKEAVESVRNTSLKKEILNTDIPRFADLEEFLHSFKGQVLEFKLQDGRIIGIYPDQDKLQGKYSSEFHISTILNLARLQDILGYTKISVKDL